jgi:small subunit ribosomal protein S3e
MTEEAIKAPVPVEEPAVATKPTKKISIKKKFVADGVFLAELNQLFSRTIAADGYTGLEVRVSSMTTEIRIKATQHKNLTGPNNSKLKELQAIIQKRFNYENQEDNKVEVVAKPFENRGLSAHYQAEQIKHKLMSGFPVRVVSHSAMRFIMARGAKGVEISISGKLRGQRAKTQKYRAGYRVSTGEPKNQYIAMAIRHTGLRQGIIGVKVKIMLPTDPTGQYGPTHPLPDCVTIIPPKPDA